MQGSQKDAAAKPEKQLTPEEARAAVAEAARKAREKREVRASGPHTLDQACSFTQ